MGSLYPTLLENSRTQFVSDLASYCACTLNAFRCQAHNWRVWEPARHVSTVKRPSSPPRGGQFPNPSTKHSNPLSTFLKRLCSSGGSKSVNCGRFHLKTFKSWTTFQNRSQNPEYNIVMLSMMSLSVLLSVPEAQQNHSPGFTIITKSDQINRTRLFV